MAIVTGDHQMANQQRLSQARETGRYLCLHCRPYIVAGLLGIIIAMMPSSGIGEVAARDMDLILSSKVGSLKEVIRLLNEGADINAKDNNGLTALIWASNNGYVEVVKVLLERGAEINVKDNCGWTALMLASVQDHTEVVKLLKAHGAGFAFKKEPADVKQQERDNTSNDDMYEEYRNCDNTCHTAYKAGKIDFNRLSGCNEDCDKRYRGMKTPEQIPNTPKQRVRPGIDRDYTDDERRELAVEADRKRALRDYQDFKQQHPGPRGETYYQLRNSCIDCRDQCGRVTAGQALENCIRYCDDRFCKYFY